MSKKYLGLLLICSAALVACGKPEAPAAIATPAVTTPAVVATAAAPEADNAVGKDEWGPRIAQGNGTLYKHALEGFTGAKGAMPARGGNASLSDDDVKAAVNYMVALSK